MDPLSITASAVALYQMASMLTTSINDLRKALKTADIRINDLFAEVEHQKTILKAIDTTLRGRHAVDLASVDEDLCQECEKALLDCQLTLGSLQLVIAKIKDDARKWGRGWRLKAVKDLSSHEDDIKTYKDKIHKSNWALQTMLHTITVSLALKNHESLSTVLLKLDRFELSIRKALDASLDSAGVYNTDARVATNLRNLANAAGRYCSAASSTAGSIRGGSLQSPTHHDSVAASFVGDLPPFRRQRVEEYIRERYASPQRSLSAESPVRVASPPPRRARSPTRRLRRTSMTETVTASPAPIERTPASTFAQSMLQELAEEEDAEVSFEREMLDMMEVYARDRIRLGDFAHAETLLKDAMRKEMDLGNNEKQLRMWQTQLAFVHLFRGQRRDAGLLIQPLAAAAPKSDLVVNNLLHALAIARLNKWEFTEAEALCKQALAGKRAWLKASNLKMARDCDVTLGLLAHIHDTRAANTDDVLAAAVYRSKLTPGYEYVHPRNELDFIEKHPTLLVTVFGKDVPQVSLTGSEEVEVAELAGYVDDTDSTVEVTSANSVKRSATSASPIAARMEHHLKYEADTSKVVVLGSKTSLSALSGTTKAESVDRDADDEASPVKVVTSSPLGRKMTKLFKRQKSTFRAPPEVEADDSPTLTRRASRWLRRSKTQQGRKPRAIGKSTTTAAFRGPASFETRIQRMSGIPETPEDVGAATELPCRTGHTCLDNSSRRAIDTQEGDETIDLFTEKNGVTYVAMPKGRRARSQSAPKTSGNESGSIIAELDGTSADMLPKSSPSITTAQEATEAPRQHLSNEQYWSNAARALPSGVVGLYDPSAALSAEELRATMNATEVPDVLHEIARIPPLPLPHADESDRTDFTTWLEDLHHQHYGPDLKKKGSIKVQIPRKEVESALNRKNVTKLTEEHGKLLADLASVCASLPTFKTDLERHVAKARLALIKSHLESLSGDEMLLGDIERIYKSLEVERVKHVVIGGIKRPKSQRKSSLRSIGDSGYESMPVIEESESEEDECPKETANSPILVTPRKKHDKKQDQGKDTLALVESQLSDLPVSGSRSPARLQTSFSFKKGEDEAGKIKSARLRTPLSAKLDGASPVVGMDAAALLMALEVKNLAPDLKRSGDRSES